MKMRQEAKVKFVSHRAFPRIPHNLAGTGAPLAAPKLAWGMHPQAFTILAIALLLRLLIVWFVIAQFPHGWLYSRGIELGTLAHSLLAGQGLSSPFGGSTGPTALLAPGYPAVIALVFRIFGVFQLCRGHRCYGDATLIQCDDRAGDHAGCATVLRYAISPPLSYAPSANPLNVSGQSQIFKSIQSAGYIIS
jgi:hypothetical protein